MNGVVILGSLFLMVMFTQASETEMPCSDKKVICEQEAEAYEPGCKEAAAELADEAKSLVEQQKCNSNYVAALGKCLDDYSICREAEKIEQAGEAGLLSYKQFIFLCSFF